MITTTFNIGDTLYTYNGSTIDVVTVYGVIVAPSEGTEDYLCSKANGEKFRYTESQLQSSIDGIADKIVQALQAKFESEMTATKAAIEQAVADYNSQAKGNPLNLPGE